MPTAATSLRRALVALLGAVAATPLMAGTAAAATAETTPRPTVKPLLTGLLDRDGPPPAALEDIVKSYVLNVDWKDLQPSSGDTLATAALDQALTQAKDRGARVKLRIMAGIHAPDWAKALGGGAVSLDDPHDGRTGTVPRFWTPAFGAAYAHLHELLAERYDSNPRVAEVVISRCTTFYAEPFIRQTSDAGNRKALLAAGYTRAKDKDCHRQQVNAHKVWKRTRSGLALNPAQFMTANGGRVVDDKFTAAIMRHCRDSLGKRCVLENNSIRSPISSLDPNPDQPHYRRMYRAMLRHSPHRAFQTATSARIGSCARTLDWAGDRNARYVELPWDAADICTNRVLRAAARRLG